MKQYRKKILLFQNSIMSTILLMVYHTKWPGHRNESNCQLFYFNYCYNEAFCLGALSRYKIKREETSDE